MGFNYDIMAKRELDKEMRELIMKQETIPHKITVSRRKMEQFERVFPDINKSYYEFDLIPVELDENQEQDYNLISN